MVGGPGFEPGASRSRTVRAAGLRQPPPYLRREGILLGPHIEDGTGTIDFPSRASPPHVTVAGASIKVAVASAIRAPSPRRSMCETA